MQAYPLCYFCKYYNDSKLNAQICKAYPKGIPDKYLKPFDFKVHTKVQKDQIGNYVFERIEADEE